MSVPAQRRIVVGVDGSVESAAALRWACREASLRNAEVHAVHVREANCHSVASYAVTASADQENLAGDIGGDHLAELRQSVAAEQKRNPGVKIATEVVDGLPARELLDRCAGADMLVLGAISSPDEAPRSPGPVIRACLRRAPCPVVVISVEQPASTDQQNRSANLSLAGV